MIKALKNIGVGFIVSFIGSIPLGYLNIIAYEIYQRSGSNALIIYLLGVISIEAIVIFATLLFAQRLTENKRLIKYIEAFSIVFLLILALSFYMGSNTESEGQSHIVKYINYSPFIIGIIFSSLNFMQVPFWTGWNLYLINQNYITVEKKLKYPYLLGTISGTFLGMLALVLLLDLLSKKTGYLSQSIISITIPLFFLIMALYQTFKYYKKYHKF